MGLQSPLDGGTKPVPGGQSQKKVGDKTPLPRGANLAAYSVNVGKRRGEVGHTTADVMGRTRAQQARNAPGNYGGGYAGVTRTSKRPSGANRKG